MKKRVIIIVLTIIFAFPMVVEAQGVKNKITSSRYEIGQLDVEIIEEYVSDSISEKVIDLIEAGKAFEVSDPVETEDYEYSIISISGEENQMVIGYYVNADGNYELIELNSQKAITKAQILHYFEKNKSV